MTYELVLNPKNKRALKWLVLFGAIVLPLSYLTNELLPCLIIFIALALFLFFDSKATLQFFDHQLVYNTRFKQSTYDKQHYKLALIGKTYSFNDDRTPYYLMKIINKQDQITVRDIRMSMTEKEYDALYKKLTELKEI